jgi:hypothetical protein
MLLVLMIFKAKQFRGDQDKKKGKGKARGHRALAVITIFKSEISDLKFEIADYESLQVNRQLSATERVHSLSAE